MPRPSIAEGGSAGRVYVSPSGVEGSMRHFAGLAKAFTEAFTMWDCERFAVRFR